MSAAAKTAGPVAPPNPLGANAPAITLPLRFVLTGLASFATALVLILLRPEILSTYHYNQHVISVTHLLVLGWILTVVMGAVYQLVPVALETQLHSERLARWQFGLHVIGFAGMAWMFWRWNMTHVGHFGSALALGVAFFVYNLARTLFRVPKWSVVATSVVSVLAWLSLTVLAGLTIVAGKCNYDVVSGFSPGNPLVPVLEGLRSVGKVAGRFDQIGAMHAHAHLGAVGIFIMLIVGVSFKLVPMFTLSELQSRARAYAAVILLNAGLLGSFFSVLLRGSARPAFAALIAAGLVFYGLEMRAILRARKRRALDWGLNYFLTAISLLAPLSLLGIALSWPGLKMTALVGQLENLYGFIALMGVVSLAIFGMLYKILPFLVWYKAYSRLIGLTKVPALADLYSAQLQAPGYWLYLGGLGCAGAGIVLENALLVRAGIALLGISFGFFLANTVKILSHLRKARNSPTPAPTSHPMPASTSAARS